MRCAKCPKDPVVFQPYSGMHLCRNHIIADIEAKAKRDIRANGWLSPGDHIGILMNNDKKSLALLHFLTGLVANRRDVRVTAIFTENPVGGTPVPHNFSHFAKTRGIACVCETVTGTASLTGDTDTASPGLREIAGRHGLTKFAAGWCLDDAALAFLVSILRGNPDFFPENESEAFPPVITPFVSVPESEVDLYADFTVGEWSGPRQPAYGGFEQAVKDELDGYTKRHPATKYSLLQISKRIRSAKKGSDVRDWQNQRPEKISQNTGNEGQKTSGGDRP